MRPDEKRLIFSSRGLTPSFLAARGFATRVLRFRRAVTLQRKLRDCSQSRGVARSHARTARERKTQVREAEKSSALLSCLRRSFARCLETRLDMESVLAGFPELELIIHADL